MNTNQSSVDPVVVQKIQIPYSYVAGVAVGHFLTGLKDGVFYASACSACGRKTVPPLSFCGRCWKPITQFTPVGPRGILESFARVPGNESSAAVFALVRLEGADTCLAHLLELEPDETPTIGAAVESVWREHRVGSVLDISCFRLVKNA